MTVKVSVIMPVYNSSAFLEEAIDSILGQTFSDFELIIIDDGSTDKSLSIISKYSDSRIIKVKHIQNFGIVASLNEGLKLAKGEYVARMDSDDISLSNRLELQVKYLDSHTSIDVIGSSVKIFGGDDYLWELPVNHQDLDANFLFLNSLAHPTIMIRKSYLDKNNLQYRKKYKDAEDFDLWIRILIHGGRIANIKQPLVLYRIHQSQISHQNKAQIISTKGLYKMQLKERLNIDATEDEINLHYSIVTNNLLNSMDDIESKRKWLIKILNANRELKQYNSRLLHKTISNYWINNILNSQTRSNKYFELFKYPTSYSFIIQKAIIKLSLYILKICWALLRLIIIRTIHYKIKHNNILSRKPIAHKIALVEFPRLTLPSHVKGGDSSVHDALIQSLTQAGYKVDKIPYDPNFPVPSQFSKFLIGMPYIYRQIIKSKLSQYDLFICDSRVVWADSSEIPCISLFHDSYKGYLDLVGAGWNPLGYLNNLVLSSIQVRGTKNTYNIAVSNFLKDILIKSGIQVDKVIANGVGIANDNSIKTNTKKNSISLYLGGYAYKGKGFDIIKKLGGMGHKIDCVTNHKVSKWDNVQFLPQISHDETIETYTKYPLTLYPSRFESCQMVPLESMACGTPVLISNVGIGPELAKAIPEFVVGGYDQKAIEEYSQKIIKIQANYSHYSKLARKFVSDNYSLKKFQTEWSSTIKAFYANTL